MALVLYELEDHVATITLNRPEAHNAFSRDLLREMRDAFARFRTEEDARVAIVTGTGRVASDRSVFGLTEVTRGIIAGGGGTQRLPRMVPLAAAMEMLLTGRHVSADDALRWGLVNRVVPPDEVMPVAREIARAIASNAPLAVRASKETALRGFDVPFAEGMRIEAFLSQTIARTEDAREGPLAFAQKRKPDYKGR